MRIKSLQLKNFKRFTDLTLQDIPESAKLVLLVGSNGSGKSSVFDAFEYVASQNGKAPKNRNLDFRKNPAIQDEVKLETHDHGVEGVYNQNWHRTGNLVATSFYGRTSFRQVPRLTKTHTGSRFNLVSDSDRPASFIDRDERFENDLEHIFGLLLEEFFVSDSNKSKIKTDFLEPVNAALQRIFDTQPSTRPELIKIIPPLEGKVAQIIFRKGKTDFHYDQLSAGEKEVFNIIVNLSARKSYYLNTIYFIDEIDLHLNTVLQYNLLKEITENWIPENCQLWTASHSLGFIQYAKDTIHSVILDLDDLDFDIPQTILPQVKDNLAVYDIAIPQQILFEILKGKRLVICENRNDEYYNLLQINNTIFVGVKDSRDVFLNVKRDKRYTSLRDRDFMSDTEIEKIKHSYPNHHILRFYDFENYLYHPDNIDELQVAGFDKAAYIEEIIRQKNKRFPYILATLAASRQNYEEFKTDEKFKDKELEAIIEDFQSDELNRFYKYYDMKDQFNKSYIAPFNLSKERLAKTNWFKTQIEKILNEPN